MRKFAVTTMFMGAGVCVGTALDSIQHGGPVWTFVGLAALNLLFGLAALTRLEERHE